MLYISGRTDSIAAQSIASQRPASLLPKPFTAREVIERVRKVLDDPASDSELAADQRLNRHVLWRMVLKRQVAHFPGLLLLTGIILVGILSRVIHTGFILFDKYLGDALYAAMVYTIFRLLLMKPPTAAVSTLVVMTFVELFQLTMIPAHMLANKSWIVRACARLLGTEFSLLDLLAYGVGIGCIHLADSRKPPV